MLNQWMAYNTIKKRLQLFPAIFDEAFIKNAISEPETFDDRFAREIWNSDACTLGQFTMKPFEITVTTMDDKIFQYENRNCGLEISEKVYRKISKVQYKIHERIYTKKDIPLYEFHKRYIAVRYLLNE